MLRGCGSGAYISCAIEAPPPALSAVNTIFGLTTNLQILEPFLQRLFSQQGITETGPSLLLSLFVGSMGSDWAWSGPPEETREVPPTPPPPCAHFLL